MQIGWLRKISTYSAWVFLLAAVPFYSFPAAERWVGLLSLPAAGLLGWLALGKPLPRTGLNVFLLLLSSMVGLSAWVTFDLTLSLPKLAGVVIGLGLFFAAAAYGRSRIGWVGGIGLLLGFGVGVALLGLVGAIWPSEAADSKFPFLYQVIQRFPVLLRGLPGAAQGFNPNEIAGALLWIIPPVLGILLGGRLHGVEAVSNLGRAFGQKPARGWVNWLVLGVLVALLGLMVGLLVLTQSRSAYVGLGVALAGLLIFALPKWARLWALAAITGAVLGLAILFWPALIELGSIVTQTAPVELTSDSSGVTLAQRVQIWGWAWSLIRDFPLTGIGMNTFRSVVFLFFPAPCSTVACDFGHAHNEFLQVALDLGVPGLLAFIGVYVGAFRILVRYYRRVIHRAGRMLCLGLGGGLVAHLIYGMTDAVALGAKPGLIFWLLLGLIAALDEAPPG